ncbi:MAG TPA: AAA family ATPase [Stellaceae bacterium]|nr:AAA family ATPase [Stellaceae bacterium]
MAEPVAAAVAATSPRPFAGESAGSGYFESDHHHRYIATAIFRELAKGHGLVLLCGEHTADVDLVERFLNEEGRERYRASLVRCRPEMDFGALVRAYNRRLGLRQEAGSDGIWALLSHLMAEVRKGVRRLLVLENAESLDLTCFDELLRFMRLDEPHVMPVVLLGSADFAERLATPAFGFLNSAITGRVPFDRIEQEEVGAFLHYQLNVLPGDERALFPPEVVNLIAVRAGGSAAVINRLALDVLDQGRRDAALAAPPEPAPTITIVPPAQEAAPEPVEILEASVEPEESEQAEPLEVKAPEAETLEAEAAETDAAEAAPSEAEPAEVGSAKAELLEAPPPRLVAGGRTAISAPTGTTEKRRARLSVRTGLALYVVAAVLAGLGLLYFLAPRGHEPSATVASTAGSAQTPIAAAPDKSSAAATTAKEAPSDAAAAQAAAVEPAAGPSATPPASAPQAAPEQNGPVVIGAKIVPLTAPAPAASAPATPATSAPTASASAEPSPAASSEPTASASSAPAATTTSESATPAQPPVASAAPQPASNPPAAPAPSRAADAAPASPPASEAAAQPASPAPSEAAAPASSEAAAPAVPKAGASTASAPVAAASQPASPGPAAQASAPASSGATQAIAPLAALEPAKVPSQEQPSQPQPPKAAHPNAELTLLVQRGDELLAAGDIYSARQFYERAAQAGDPAAQCGLGKSYDPVYLRQLGARGVAGDAATAAGWYRRAAAAGNNEAAARLARLDAANPDGSNSK